MHEFKEGAMQAAHVVRDLDLAMKRHWENFGQRVRQLQSE